MRVSLPLEETINSYPMEVSGPQEGIESMTDSSVLTHIMNVVFLLAKDLKIQFDYCKDIPILRFQPFLVYLCSCSKFPSDFNPINPS